MGAFCAAECDAGCINCAKKERNNSLTLCNTLLSGALIISIHGKQRANYQAASHNAQRERGSAYEVCVHER